MIHAQPAPFYAGYCLIARGMRTATTNVESQSGLLTRASMTARQERPSGITGGKPIWRTEHSHTCILERIQIRTRAHVPLFFRAGGDKTVRQALWFCFGVSSCERYTTIQVQRQCRRLSSAPLPILEASPFRPLSDISAIILVSIKPHNIGKWHFCETAAASSHGRYS